MIRNFTLTSLSLVLVIVWSHSASASTPTIPPRLLASTAIAGSPSGAAAGSGYLFWFEWPRHIHRMSTELTDEVSWPSLHEINTPACLAVDRWRHIYVSESAFSQTMHEYSTDLVHLKAFCSGAEEGSQCRVSVLAVDGQGAVFGKASDKSRYNEIVRFAPSGEIERVWGGTGSGPGQFTSLTGISADRDGNVYAFEYETRRVQKFDRDGRHLLEWNLSSGGIRTLGNFTVDPNGYALVGDMAANVIHVFDPSGSHLGSWSVTRAGSITTDEDGNIYVLSDNLIEKYEKLHPPPVPPLPPAEPAVLLHIVSAEPGQGCSNTPTQYDDVVTHANAVSAEGTPYYVYFLASPRTLDGGSAGISGIQATITYDHGTSPASGIAVWSWQHCAEWEFAQDGWPQSGTGNTITWSKSTCRQELLVPAGYLYIGAYSPAAMAVTGYSSTGLVKIANCDGAERVVEASRQGWISIGGATYSGKVGTSGCNPLLESCTAQVSARSATWGQIKTRYH